MIIFISRCKIPFFLGLHSALDFIPCYPSLRSVPLGIKSPALFQPKKWISHLEKKLSYLFANAVAKNTITYFLILHVLYFDLALAWQGQKCRSFQPILSLPLDVQSLSQKNQDKGTFLVPKKPKDPSQNYDSLCFKKS